MSEFWQDVIVRVVGAALTIGALTLATKLSQHIVKRIGVNRTKSKDTTQ